MNFTWNIIDFSVCLIETIILFKYLRAVITNKFSNTYNWLWVLLITIISFVLSIIEISDALRIAILYITIYIFILFLFLEDVFKKLMAFCCFILINMAIENTVIFFVISILNIEISEIRENTPSRFIAILLAKLILFLWATYYVQKKRESTYYLSIKANKSLIFKIISLFILVIFMMILVLNIYNTNDELYAKIYQSFNILILIFAGVCIVCVSIFEGISKESEKQMKMNLSLQQKEIKYKYNKELEATVENIRGIKHDISNHLSVISGYIQCNEYEKAKDYIYKLSKPINTANELLFIDHPAISSILYVKTILAEKRKIDIKVETKISSEIKIMDIDITILLGNILDNAIEACEHVSEEEKRIKISIVTKDGYILIDCINSMNQDRIKVQNEGFATTKQDKINHGIGLKNIKTVIEKYHGEMRIDTTNDEFIIKTTVVNNNVD
ncbi:MAG: sensor histidine kinase [Eubacteriaceae bacterium]